MKNSLKITAILRHFFNSRFKAPTAVFVGIPVHSNIVTRIRLQVHGDEACIDLLDEAKSETSWWQIDANPDIVAAICSGAAIRQGDKLTIKSGAAAYTVAMSTASNNDLHLHTALEWHPERTRIFFPAAAFAAIRRTVKFASTDETRYVLNSIGVVEGKVVATDGRRLHIEECPVECTVGTGGDASVKAAEAWGNRNPYCHMSWLSTLLAASPADAEATIMLVPQPQGMCVVATLESQDPAAPWSLRMATMQPTGNYPNYQQVIPSETSLDLTAVAEAEEVAKAAVAMSKSTPRRSKNDKDTSVSVKTHFHDGRLTIHRPAPGGGEVSAAADMDVRRDVTAAYNAHYFAEAMAAMSGHIRFHHEASDPAKSPMLISNTIAKHVLMPMRMS